MSIGTPWGVWLVARQEFRIRLRTGRWRWLLGVWVLVLALFTGLLDLSLNTGYGFEDDDTRRGVPLFGILMLFVLFLVLVISPALTSQVINGDRERGTLATLQVTRLRPLEIALGKLVAGWGVGLVALALTLPFTGWAMASGGITFERVAAVYAVMALLIGSVCAVSQALSALLARSITSALLSYVVVAALTVGTLISIALVAPLIVEEHTETSSDGFTYTYEQVRQDKVWWLLAPNPFVILADSAPQVPPRITETGDVVRIEDYDPLSAIGRVVRDVRRSPYEDSFEEPLDPRLAVWPYGVGFHLLLGAGAVAVTAARLRAPVRRVPRGVRIA
jgi:ABC-type transport system involved in multi-copper enzyme maturation permease subunit